MCIGVLLISGCNLLRFVPKGKSLVENNKVKIEGDEKFEDINEQILLVPNRKLLGVVKLNLWSYYFGQTFFPRDSVYRKVRKKVNGKKVVYRVKKANKAKRIFTEIIGEKPSYLDSNMVKKSQKNLKEYLFQKGYYHAEVTSKVKTILQRSYITYFVNPGSYYVIRKVAYNGSDIVLDKNANEFAANSILTIGNKVDYEKLSEERDRITAEFRDHGFYYFNKAFIDEIIVDTGGHDRGANIIFNINNPGSVRNARQQTIHKVIVEMNYNPEFLRRDTLKYPKINPINYLFNGYQIKPNIINRSIVMRPKELFSQRELDNTYNKLLGLGLFKQVSISVLPYKSDTTNKLIVYINLTPMARHDHYLEPQAITSDKQTNLNSSLNNYGIAISYTLNNKNVFKNAEDFNIKFRTAAEKQFGNNSGTPVVININKFELARFKVSNFESNLTFELQFPKLVGLRKLDLKPYLQTNRTAINISYINEVNTSYERRSIPISFAWQTNYQTKDKQAFKFYYSPIQVSYNKAKVNAEFLSRVDNVEDSLRLVRTFRSYVIPSQRASIEYTNINKSPKEYWTIRSTLFELSGNLIELGYRLFTNNTAKEKDIFGISEVPYFQYFRTEIDVVRYKIFAKNKTMVLRANIGYGTPYGNSIILPFERQFYVGGSNSLRGWRPRVLGPGNYNNSGPISLNKTGDMMIVTNAEYRFAIAPGKLDGAFFMDAGNIWTVTKNADVESKFYWDKFIKQMAVNTGIGIRYISFFVLRADLGIKLHDPTKPAGSRWVIRDSNTFSKAINNTNLQIAVGYPF